jgi:Fe-S oxidoreductase
VKIDFGDVSMNMRNLLRKMGQKSFRPGNAAAMFMLNATNPADHQACAAAMVGVGFKAQRLANDLLRGLAHQAGHAPPSTHGRAPIKEQVIHFINKKLPGGLPKKTARALLDIEDKDYVPIIRDPKATTAETEAVFYFPGCGSSACSRRWAWPRRPCCGTPACRPCCRPATCAAAIRSAAPASSTRPRR